MDKKLIKGVDLFLAEQRPLISFGKWIYGNYTDLYIRKSFRFVDMEKIETLEISSITVKEKYQKKGIFTGLLKHCMENWDHSIYVENIMEENIIPLLIREGFKEHYPGIAPCYILIRSKGENK